MHDKRVWTIGALLFAVVLLFGGYFLGVSPQLDAAAAADSQRQTVDAQNQALQADIAVLKRDYEDIATFKQQLADASVAVPDNAEFASYFSQLHDMSSANAVTVSGITIDEGKPYVGPVNAAALNLPMGAERKASEAAAKAARTGDANDVALAAALEALAKRVITAPAESANVTPQTFVAIPVSIQIKGDYDRVLDYIGALQSGQRLTLVHTLNLAPDDAATGLSGAYTADIGAYVYVLINPADAPVDPAVAAADAAAAAQAAADAAAAE